MRIELVPWLKVGYELGKCWEAFVMRELLPGDALIRGHVLGQLRVALANLDMEIPAIIGAWHDLRSADQAWQQVPPNYLSDYRPDSPLFPIAQHLRGVHAYLVGYDSGALCHSAFEYGFELGRSILETETIAEETVTESSRHCLLVPVVPEPFTQHYWRFRDPEKVRAHSDRLTTVPEELTGLPFDHPLSPDIPDVAEWINIYPYHRLGWHYTDIRLTGLARQNRATAGPPGTPSRGQNQPPQEAPSPCEQLGLTMTDTGTVTRILSDGPTATVTFETDTQPYRLFRAFIEAPNFTITFERLKSIWVNRGLGPQTPLDGTVQEAVSALRRKIAPLKLVISRGNPYTLMSS